MFYNKTRGPFVNSASLSAFFQRMLTAATMCGAHPDYRGNPLVFTHNDLRMGNILMGPDGTLRLIDFAYSGFYPRHFEYIAMDHAAKYAKLGNFFTALIPFIADPYFEERL
jgi:thiamine kinase-like enzyme